MKLIETKEYLLLIDEGAEIKREDWFISFSHEVGSDEFLMTTDTKIAQRLISDNNPEWFDGWINGVSDDDNFQKLQGNYELQYCKKIIAYYPLTKEAKELNLPLLPNPFKE